MPGFIHPALHVAEVWNAISAKRSVTRTTVLNLVNRLEKRGWLKRRKKGRTFHYVATVERETTAGLVASEFVDEFFGGSASSLVMSLLGSNRLKTAELARLRKLLDDATAQKKRKGDSR